MFVRVQGDVRRTDSSLRAAVCRVLVQERSTQGSDQQCHLGNSAHSRQAVNVKSDRCELCQEMRLAIIVFELMHLFKRLRSTLRETGSTGTCRTLILKYSPALSKAA